MRIIRNNEIDIYKWENLIVNSVNSSPFQSPAFLHFFNSLDGFKADAFASEEDGNLTSLMIVTIQEENGLLKYFSRRGIIYGGPIVEVGKEASFTKLLEEAVKAYRRKLIFIEIRNYFDYSFLDRSLKSAQFSFVPWLNFQLQIADADTMKKAMSSSRLRQIKKAIKSGATWDVADKQEDVVAFYNILNGLYKNKIKKPLFPLDFFTTFFQRKIGVFLLVYYENKVIGGIMCPVLPNKAIYEFYVCGLDTEFKDQYPSVMATWAAMEYAAQHNIKVFDFMGAGSPDEDYGVREFKSRFGGNEVNHGRYLRVINPLLYQVGKWGLKILLKFKR